MSLAGTDIGKIIREALAHLVPFLRWIALCLVLLYIFSGVYSISSNEIGILQRFGKVIDDKVQPGIHYRLPWPVDRVTRVPIKTVSRIQVDDFYSLGEGTMARVFAGMTGLDSYCVTGDNNLVNVSCVIQYTITNPCKYLFSVASPDIMLRSMASNTIIHCLATMPIDDALTRGKQQIANYIKHELQKRLDDSQCGLSISFVELSDIKPPDRVERYFSDVVKADIDKAKMINMAESYRNEKIPAAQADATKILQEAGAYKTEVVLRAEGDASRFEKLLEQVQKKGGSSRTLLYLDTMRDILRNVGKKHFVGRDTSGKPPARLRLYPAR